MSEIVDKDFIKNLYGVLLSYDFWLTNKRNGGTAWKNDFRPSVWGLLQFVENWDSYTRGQKDKWGNDFKWSEQIQTKIEALEKMKKAYLEWEKP